MGKRRKRKKGTMDPEHLAKMNEARRAAAEARKAKGDWRYNAADIKKTLGFAWAKSKINRFDHTKLELVSIETHYPSTSAATRLEYRQKFQGRGLRPVRTDVTPPPPFRTKGYRLFVHVYPWDIPWPVAVNYPPLYRRPGGVWESAPDATDYAVTWPNEILDGYSAMWMAEPVSALCDEWASEHRQDKTTFGPIIKIKRDGFDTEYVQVRGAFDIKSVDEAIVYGTAQAAYRWLRATRQIPGRKSAHNRDHFAMGYVRDFREWARAERKRKGKSKARRKPHYGFPAQPSKPEFPGFPGQD